MPEPASLPRSRLAQRGHPLALFGFLALQSLCVLLLMADAIADFFGSEAILDGTTYHLLELAVVSVLILGMVLTAREIRDVLRRNRSMETSLRAASGAFNQLIEDHFDAWSLSPSERDVALLAIKGLSIAEIAALRQTREGTVKAQCNATYRKAGVSGRLQLLSLFIDELMGDGLSPASGQAQE